MAGQLGFPSLRSLVLSLGDAPALLVLDNCEHVRAAAAALCRELLAEVPALAVLATSREPLGVDGETLLELGPLALPASGDRADVEAAPATRLFAERARSAGARASATAAEFEAIADLCRRLDGVPLAIELAAARARSLTSGELLAHLDRRFDLLRRAEPVGRARHASLRAAIDTSYELLDEEERAFFRALGVFAGPFGAELAHAVAAPRRHRPPGDARPPRAPRRPLARDREPARRRHAVPAPRLAAALRGGAQRAKRASGRRRSTASSKRCARRPTRSSHTARAAGAPRCSTRSSCSSRTSSSRSTAASSETPTRRARSGSLLPLWGAIHQGRATEVAAACERILARWPEGAGAAARRGAARWRRARRSRRAGPSARRSSARRCSAIPRRRRSRT